MGGNLNRCHANGVVGSHTALGAGTFKALNDGAGREVQTNERHHINQVVYSHPNRRPVHRSVEIGFGTQPLTLNAEQQLPLETCSFRRPSPTGVPPESTRHRTPP